MRTSNGNVLYSPDTHRVKMKLLKPKTFTVALTGIRQSLLQPHIPVSASGLFQQVWACGTVLTPPSLMKGSEAQPYGNVR